MLFGRTELLYYHYNIWFVYSVCIIVYTCSVKYCLRSLYAGNQNLQKTILIFLEYWPIDGMDPVNFISFIYFFQHNTWKTVFWYIYIYIYICVRSNITIKCYTRNHNQYFIYVIPILFYMPDTYISQRSYISHITTNTKSFIILNIFHEPKKKVL